MSDHPLHWSIKYKNIYSLSLITCKTVYNYAKFNNFLLVYYSSATSLIYCKNTVCICF